MKSEGYITIPELAKLMGISRIAVFNKVKSGQIKAVKIGRNYAIPAGYFDKIRGRVLDAGDKQQIDKAVKKAVNDYGETLKLLGKE